MKSEDNSTGTCSVGSCSASSDESGTGACYLWAFSNFFNGSGSFVDGRGTDYFHYFQKRAPSLCNGIHESPHNEPDDLLRLRKASSTEPKAVKVSQLSLGCVPWRDLSTSRLETTQTHMFFYWSYRLAIAPRNWNWWRCMVEKNHFFGSQTTWPFMEQRLPIMVFESRLFTGRRIVSTIIRRMSKGLAAVLARQKGYTERKKRNTANYLEKYSWRSICFYSCAKITLLCILWIGWASHWFWTTTSAPVHFYPLSNKVGLVQSTTTQLGRCMDGAYVEYGRGCRSTTICQERCCNCPVKYLEHRFGGTM